MFPIALDLTRIPILLAGESEMVRKRLAYLDEANAGKVTVYCNAPNDALRQAAGVRLREAMPVQADTEGATIVMLAGLERAFAETITGWARGAGKLVNVEDVTDLCDFYFTANLRRGELVIAVSTSGASPTLARKIRDTLAAQFGEEWSERVRHLADLRHALRARGLGMQEIMQKTEAFLAEKGWLPVCHPGAKPKDPPPPMEVLRFAQDDAKRSA